MVGTARIGTTGQILVAVPLPANYSQQLKEIEDSQRQYWELHQQRKAIRRTYMGFLLAADGVGAICVHVAGVVLVEDRYASARCPGGSHPRNGATGTARLTA